MSQEEFFMYLTIGLILVIPISVRLYRYLMITRVKRQIREQLQRHEPRQASDSSKPQ
jgi:hypothetical protein